MLVCGFGGPGKLLSLSGRGVFSLHIVSKFLFSSVLFVCLFVFCGFVPAACLQSSAPASGGHGVSPSVQSRIYAVFVYFPFKST